MIHLYFGTAPWREAANRRIFFENYAKSNGFDPLIAANWYLVPSDKIMAMKVSFYHYFPTFTNYFCRGHIALYGTIKIQ